MASRGATFQALAGFINAELLDGVKNDLDADTPLLEWGVLGSDALHSLLMFIECELGVRIPTEGVRSEHFWTLRSVVDFVETLPKEVPRDPSLFIGATWRDIGVSFDMRVLTMDGRAPTWVFLPELAAPATSFLRLIDLLRGQYGTATLDYGRADDFDALVEACAAALDTQVVGELVLVGHGSGAVLARALARRRRPLALVCLGLGAPSQRPAPRWRSFAQAPESFLSGLGHLPNTHAQVQARLASPAYTKLLSGDHGLLDVPSAPTLVVHGSRDAVVTVYEAERMAQQLGASIEHVPRGGHWLPLERPKELAAIIARFVRACSTP